MDEWVANREETDAQYYTLGYGTLRDGPLSPTENYERYLVLPQISMVLTL